MAVQNAVATEVIIFMHIDSKMGVAAALPSPKSHAHQQIKEIKQNLSHSVQKCELWPGALYWTNRLKSFLRVYGLHFSKEDHVHLIHLLFELVTGDNLESPLLGTWSTLLTHLLKKLKILSRDDLCLPWRPLYALRRRIFYSKFSELGMKIYPQHTCLAVEGLIQHARNYFPAECTKDMLEEWLPLLCPFDLSSVEGAGYLSEFLPTRLPSHFHQCSFKLWFEKLMTFWMDLPLSSSTEEPFIKLFVRLARHCMGYVDWSPYLSRIFSRVLRSFSLQVGRQELHGNSKGKDCLTPHLSAHLIIGMLNGCDPKPQDHLSSLMLSLESYYHPSNVGKHTRTLLTFLKELTCSFIKRLKSEQFATPKWFSNIPQSAKLSDNCIDLFVQSLLPSLKLAMFSKFGTSNASAAFHRLSLIRPEMVLPDLLTSTYQALDTVTEPHQVTATLQCVSAVSRALLNGGMGRYPEGRRHMFSLLMLALPGIDANDFRKTITSGLLISSLVSLVPLVDSSVSVNSETLNMNEEERELSLMTAQFEDFVIQFLDRCFGIIDDTRLEQVAPLDRLVSTSRSFNHEAIMGLGLSGSMQIVLNQCSPQIFQVAVEKIHRYATGHVFESEVAGKMCADMCSAAAKVDPVSTLKLFLPYCIQSIETVLSDPEQFEAEHPDHDLLWSLQLLSKILQNVGSAMLPFADSLIACLQKCVHLKSKSGSSDAAKSLTNMLVSLTMTYPVESCSTCVGFSVSPDDHNYIKDWAAPGDIDNVKMKWHVPTLQELQLADTLLHAFLKPEIERLKSFVAGQQDMDRDTLHQSLHFVAALINGVTAYLPGCEGQQVEGCPVSVVELKDHHFRTSALSKTPPEEFQRERLLSFIHKLSNHILCFCDNDTKSMFTLIKVSHFWLF
ncbi:proteasome activator complex subunit 4-like, partial [Halichondria panicea]|uniref:proteasome activator complex subunit 4-like n=1 Tax=Halichondria panicea TaxID=6063 RepID=UPI00312B87F8